jgi:uncharacterized membrane protein YfcA
VLVELLVGGIPGVIAGCLLGRKVPANKLKTAVALVAIFAGLQLVWAGTRAFTAGPHATNSAKITAQAHAEVRHAR